MQQIHIENFVIHIIRKKIKNLYLTVSAPDGKIHLKAPLKTDETRIKHFVGTNISWIKKQIAKFEHYEPVVEKNYISGEFHEFQGKSYRLEVIYHYHKVKKVILKNQEVLELYVPHNATVEQRKRILKDWYDYQLSRIIPPLISQWQAIIGVQALEWRIKQMKTKWGTCNIRARRIWFNLELVKKPLECLEYIVVHELVHLLEPSHNKRFYQFMDQFLPDWKIRKQRLNQREKLIHAE